MKSRTRKQYVSLNIITGSLSHVISLLLQLVSRTIFINTLGIEYLGINSMFYNILMLLSLADLGFGSAIVYSMYKPLLENDTDTIVALMTYYKRIYHRIAIVVAIIGIGMLPLLPYVVNLDTEIPYLPIYYLLYVANIVISYLMAYRYTIITADQKGYLITIYSLVGTILQTLVQIVILVVFKNFMLYLIVFIVRTFLVNWFQSNKAKKVYPFISGTKELDLATKKSIFENVKSMFLYKFGGVLLNNTDNFIISMMIGTVYVGLYSNYLTIIVAVYHFTDIIFDSITSSVGNLNASKDSEWKFEIFKILNFIVFWIMTFCSVCFLVLFNDFITLWIGKEYIFGMLTVIVIVINFFMPGTLTSVSIYRDTTGMFRQTKYVFLITAFINLVLSIWLGKSYGLFGILLATAIARLLTNMWYEPYVLFKSYFKRSPIQYFKRQALYWLIAVASCLITYFLATLLPSTTVFHFILKIVLCLIAPNALILALFYRTKEFHYIYHQVIRKISDKLLSKKRA